MTDYYIYFAWILESASKAIVSQGLILPASLRVLKEDWLERV